MKTNLPLRERIWQWFYFSITRLVTGREERRFNEELSGLESAETTEEFAYRLERITESIHRISRTSMIIRVITIFTLLGGLSIVASYRIAMSQTGVTQAEWLQGILSGIGVEAIGAVMTFILIEVVWIRWDSRREKEFKTQMERLQGVWDIAYPDKKPSYTNFRTPPPED